MIPTLASFLDDPFKSPLWWLMILLVVGLGVFWWIYRKRQV